LKPLFDAFLIGFEDVGLELEAVIQ